MRWYWYVARNDELMMDLDSPTLLEIALKRLERSTDYTKTKCMGNGFLKVRSTFVAPSNHEDHFHMIIRLAKPMDTLHRLTWQLFFMDHVYRSMKNFFRVLDGVAAPSLLISPTNWRYNDNAENTYFWRPPDTTCRCKNHKDPDKIWKCPAHLKLRGPKP